ncbi:MAG: alpha/beta hydrolase family protein [Tangfeifania sp.]
MNKQTLKQNHFLCFFAFLLSFQLSAQVNINQNFTGNWSGEMELSGSKLELIFKISLEENGELSVKMDVPAQGAMNLPVSKTEVKTDSIFLQVAMIAGHFSGKKVSDTTIIGNWSQSGLNFPLTLNRTEKVTELKRPQTPQPPFPYHTEEVSYENTRAGIKLAGTLTLPEQAENVPAVILISGSGPQDRDETIFEHKPFWVIADYLTRNGIAVLRVDDRGVGGSEGNTGNSTSKDFAGDVLAGIEFLKTRKEISHSKIGLIGHSEGGIIAPIVANETRDVAFIVLLAGPGIPGEQILYEQGRLIGLASGMTEEQVAQNRKTQEAIFNIIKTEKDSVVRLDRLQRTLTGGMYPMMNEDQNKAIDQQVATINSPWFHYFLTYDPRPALSKLKCPVMAIIGEKDLQVPPKSNLPAIEKALKEGGNENFKTMELPHLNHLFQHCETGSVAEYAQIEETISPEALKIVAEWIWKVME